MTVNRSPEETWARPVSRLHAGEVPEGGHGYNVDGRQVTNPQHGFGRLWRKTYRVPLDGCTLSPPEVMQVWKAEFPKFQPAGNNFYPPLAGVRPGELLFIDARLPIWPGSPGIVPISSGVLVLYADDEMFTVMTPEGFPEAGWNTFSVYEEDGRVYAQVQGMCRATDPIYEFGWRFMGGAPFQEKTWIAVLEALAARFGVTGCPVQVRRECVDRSVQWRYARNIWQNAMIRTMLYVCATPFRRLRK